MASFQSQTPGDLLLIEKKAYDLRPHTDTLHIYRPQSHHHPSTSVCIFVTAAGFEQVFLVCGLCLVSVTIYLHEAKFHLQTSFLKNPVSQVFLHSS